MADNFLERQMADYREGRLSKSNSIRKSNSRANILIADSTAHNLEPIAQCLIKNGCKVAICHPDYTRGNQIAQHLGARLYIADMTTKEDADHVFSNLIKVWKEIDYILVGDDDFGERLGITLMRNILMLRHYGLNTHLHRTPKIMRISNAISEICGEQNTDLCP